MMLKDRHLSMHWTVWQIFLIVNEHNVYDLKIRVDWNNFRDLYSCLYVDVFVIRKSLDRKKIMTKTYLILRHFPLGAKVFFHPVPVSINKC